MPTMNGEHGEWVVDGQIYAGYEGLNLSARAGLVIACSARLSDKCVMGEVAGFECYTGGPKGKNGMRGEGDRKSCASNGFQLLHCRIPSPAVAEHSKWLLPFGFLASPRHDLVVFLFTPLKIAGSSSFIFNVADFPHFIGVRI